MSTLHNDIDDDEIRIISSGQETDIIDIGSQGRRARRKSRWMIPIAVISAILTVIFIMVYLTGSTENQEDIPDMNITVSEMVEVPAETAFTAAPYVDISDTTAGGVPLRVFIPRNSTPTLHIGSDVLNDTAAVLVVQAADVRGDNGEILGAYVNEGILISKGRSKTGFCAIIGGKPVIGVADATPFLEQAIETDGYFFRQYPLVVGGQIVENKPRGRALRKALAELDGETAVVMSRDRLTFHDFAAALVDLGVTNAIYLVGSTTPGFAVKSDRERIDFGGSATDLPPNTNYIVWRQGR